MTDPGKWEGERPQKEPESHLTTSVKWTPDQDWWYHKGRKLRRGLVNETCIETLKFESRFGSLDQRLERVTLTKNRRRVNLKRTNWRSELGVRCNFFDVLGSEVKIFQYVTHHTVIWVSTRLSKRVLTYNGTLKKTLIKKHNNKSKYKTSCLTI